MRSIRRASVVVGAAALLVLAWAVPAAAHVTVNPDTAVKGSYSKLTFRVPNEMDNANTTKLDVKFPTDHPIANVSVQPKEGWTYHVTMATLPKALKTSDGQVTQVVSEISWSGGVIKPGEFDEFSVSAGPLPTDTDQLLFPSLQTYSNNQVVSWIETQQPGGPEPAHPAPLLHLVDAASSTASTGASGSADTSAGSGAAATQSSQPAVGASPVSKSQVDSANTKAVIGIILGAIGVIVAVAGVTVGSRRSSAAAAAARSDGSSAGGAGGGHASDTER